MGRADLIGNSKQHLIPTYQPKGTEGEYKSARKKIRLLQAIQLNEITSKRIIIQIRSVHKRVRYLLSIQAYLLVKQAKRDHLVVKVNQSRKLVDNDKTGS